MGYCVAVIGAGRMGSVVAANLPQETRKIIYDNDVKKAQELAQEVSGVHVNTLENTVQADMILIVLPAPAVNSTVEKLLKTAKNGTIIVNMATSAHISSELHQQQNFDIVDAKIIGHAKSISRGAPSIVVVNCPDKTKFKLIKEQLAGFYKVERGDTNLVEKINSLASREAIITAVSLSKKLKELQVPQEWINVAINTVFIGTLKAYLDNDLGHFAQGLVKKLEQEQQEL